MGAVLGGGWGCGPEQWLGFIISSGGTHSFLPCSVNILEHSGMSPGALYLNNIILYIDIYVPVAAGV